LHVNNPPLPQHLGNAQEDHSSLSALLKTL
jgi:hypothetical protein